MTRVPAPSPAGAGSGARIVISANAAWNILNFRIGLIRSLEQAGHEVIVLAPADPAADRLRELGVAFRPIAIDSKGVSPVRDARLLRHYVAALRDLKPDLFLGCTAKPNVYGSLAAHLLGIKVINNVSGLGTAFIREGLLTRILSALYRLAFRKSATIFFQNGDDRDLFVGQGIVPADRARLLPGSGIDLDHFCPWPAPEARSGRTFLLIARLLWDKGVGEYAQAARKVRAARPDARFQLLGFLDVENRTAVPRAEVDQWVHEGILEYLGHAEDVRPHIAAADCVVLPSYREGLPRVLLEAAAMARPVITTDTAGCRDAVRDGQTGFLCAVKDVDTLAAAMLRMIDMGAPSRRRMGERGRAFVADRFDRRIVEGLYAEAVEQALDPRSEPPAPR